MPKEALEKQRRGKDKREERGNLGHAMVQ